MAAEADEDKYAIRDLELYRQKTDIKKHTKKHIKKHINKHIKKAPT